VTNDQNCDFCGALHCNRNPLHEGRLKVEGGTLTIYECSNCAESHAIGGISEAVLAKVYAAIKQKKGRLNVS
jgi:Zn-finger protein